jgi:uncharacterized membrane protein
LSPDTDTGPRRRWSATGAVVGSLFWIIAWLPSLLPLGTVLQGAAIGTTAAVGYGLGTAGSAIGHLVSGRHSATPADTPAKRPVRRWVALVAVAAALLAGLPLSRSLADQATEVGAPTLAPSWLLSSLIGLLVVALLVAFGRGCRALSRWSARRLWRRTGAAAQTLGALTTVVAGVLLVAVSVAAMGLVFDRIDTSEAGQTAPTSTTRSGGPGSLISWASLGHEGRKFVTGGATQTTIRTFAGLGSADSPQARADLAVADLLRAGAATKRTWIVISTTGNGQIDPVAAEAAEAATGGDVALVATQYSTLPSWLSFLTDQAAAGSAGQALLTAANQARATLPVASRPRLVLYGESLGASGSAQSFAGMTPEQVTAQIDGALWVGPPASAQPITGWTAEGTPPRWQPTVGGGAVVRYAATAAAAAAPPGDLPWGPKRLLVLSNPTDPVVWFDQRLIFSRPDWLDDPRGPGVAVGTAWTPLLFFLAIAFDLPPAGGMPSGVGHDYADALPAAWRQVLG